MKKLSTPLAVFIVLALLAVTATSALAAGNPPPGGGGGNGHNARGNFAVVGTITALDPGAQTVTIQVLSGNKLVQPYVGQTITLQTTATTRFLLADPAGGAATVISFADLQVGQSVNANGRVANNVWTAARLTAGVSLVHIP